MPAAIRHTMTLMTSTVAPPVTVNRAPVLTLWAAVVAERLGHPPDLALTLGHAVAGSSARAKARSIGLTDDKDHDAEKREHELRPAIKPIHLLGRDIRVLATPDGEVLADDRSKPASPDAVRRYLAKAFGDRLADVRAAMTAAAATVPPERLNQLGFRIYEGFRPDIAAGAQGWGAKGQLSLDRVQSAADEVAG